MAPASSRPDPSPRSERRQFLLAAAVISGLVLVGLIVSMIASPASLNGPRKDSQGQLQEQGGAKPHIIPRPGTGHAPTNPGDPGGWEQYLVLGIMMGGMVLCAVAVWRSSVKARRRQQRTGSPPSGVGGATPASN